MPHVGMASGGKLCIGPCWHAFPELQANWKYCKSAADCCEATATAPVAANVAGLTGAPRFAESALECMVQMLRMFSDRGVSARAKTREQSQMLNCFRKDASTKTARQRRLGTKAKSL